jgi:hypothetical protein
VRCLRCDASLPDAAQFCPSCGFAADEAVTLGATRSPQSEDGWLSASDSISHGRFTPGMLLDGRYRIIALLGRGGMGEVYRADDLRLGQPVALKFLPEGLHDDPARLARFHNEVRTAREVAHANVCCVYDIGEADGLLHLSMEYVDGEDLASSLRRMGRFPEDRAVEIARQICAGVAAAHQRGVIHRDLKPANIMLDGTGRVRVMDFGLATAGRVEDIRVGTPAYMAPEQLMGREVTFRSDIFALGLVMYELFTGRRVFTAETAADLIRQHESRAIAPPSTVSNLDVAIERVILRCLETDPQRRPASALAVSAALPGGDPLAAALAAGETPSPEMVAASGEGAGLGNRAGWLVLIAVLAGLGAALAMALRTSALDRMRPVFTDQLLARKARDAIRQIGYTDVPRDAEYGFEWNDEFMTYVRQNDKPAPRWTEVLAQRPSPLQFWYRQSSEALTAITFHTDLLTPGIVRPDDPPPITSGMIQVDLDHNGLLTFFEAIPVQRQETPIQPSTVDWRPLFVLSGLEMARFQPTEPLWNWLASPDTRAAWTGVWPGTNRTLRVEAAAFGGRPVAFMLAGPWRTPWRMPEPASAVTTTYFLLLMATSGAVLVIGIVLARSNLRAGRGDRRGAARLAVWMTTLLLGLWMCSVHVVVDATLIVMFLLAVCTSVAYGALLWTVYLALEPFVRRHWPQVLVSWTNVLSGRLSDPVVGRDVLVGVGLGVWFYLIFRTLIFLVDYGFSSPGEVELLRGLRRSVGVVLEEAPYAVRNVLLYFFVLFVLRVLFRNEWAAAIAFTAFWAILTALGSDPVWAGALAGVLFYGTAAFVISRWGLLSFAIGTFVNSLLFDVPATLDASAWYFGNVMLLIAIVVGLALWGFYTSVGHRMWSTG